MTQEERLQALKDIRWGLQIAEEKLNLRRPNAAMNEIRCVKPLLDALIVDAAKGEVTKPKMTTRIVTFAIQSSGAYGEVEELANEWLDANPEAEILQSHTNMVATKDCTEFAITFVVRVPEEE